MKTLTVSETFTFYPLIRILQKKYTEYHFKHVRPHQSYIYFLFTTKRTENLGQLTLVIILFIIYSMYIVSIELPIYIILCISLQYII